SKSAMAGRSESAQLPLYASHDSLIHRILNENSLFQVTKGTSMPRTRRLICFALLAFAAGSVVADEGGGSFWLPGQFGGLSAVPGSPGWTMPAIYYHTSANADADKAFPIGGKVSVGLDADVDLIFIAPTYEFANPVWGGQLGVSIAWAFGEPEISADATLTG